MSVLGLVTRAVANQVIGSDSRHAQEAASIYAQETWSDEDYGALVSMGKPLPQELQAKTERNPVERQALNSEAFGIRARLKQVKLAREQAVYDAAMSAPKPKLKPAAPAGMQDELHAVLSDQNASEQAKLEARATLWAYGLMWPEQIEAAKCGGNYFAAAQFQTQVGLHRDTLIRKGMLP